MSKTKGKIFNACYQAVRDMEREDFVLPGDGRTWKHRADGRWSFLRDLAARANADGTFTGIKNGRAVNYSPSWERLAEQRSRRKVWQFSEDLRELGLLSWEREKRHSGRRFYTIHFEKHVPSTANLEPEHVPSTTLVEAKLVPSTTESDTYLEPIRSSPACLKPTDLPTDLEGNPYDECFRKTGRQEGRPNTSESAGAAAPPAGMADAEALKEFWTRITRFFGDAPRECKLILDKAGVAAVNAQVAEHGIKKVEQCWRTWLPAAQLTGCRFVLAKFVREFEVARAEVRAEKIAEQQAKAATSEIPAFAIEEERVRLLKEMGCTDEEYATEIIGLTLEEYHALRPEGATWQQFCDALEAKKAAVEVEGKTLAEQDHATQ